MADIIEHDDVRYEIVSCYNGGCSFCSPECIKGCRAPEWWKHIHVDCILGLKELSGCREPVRKPHRNNTRAFRCRSDSKTSSIRTVRLTN